ncbi:flavodoxin-dependent (E)-4-hydroxy-3-methylbut-2-enyl-diphosphate synthase [Fundidesulfovibrio terrae]|uniref:flavodoxin-dependent (E)-4-hydroxy-3-methylbut-2-enyl-diphosphate synthase n=1 Tax=Fundidesulfovibrio terrae TaxID=2922866 RepID=UPI001FAECCE6|nr:flavodoxin-dependent (E)-4-hydroxy-3-methylbut-2-enyl-diphosphate synthase [Fundidesulfovibrio terrae]
MSHEQTISPIIRHKNRVIRLGDVLLGGDNPIRVQSMTNTDTRDAAASIAQVTALAEAGCEIIRLAVPDEDAAKALRQIKAASPIPVIADIHFDYRLALKSLDAGVDGLRINPGNIGGQDKVAAVVRAAKERGAPIRIGVNSGSVEKHLLEKFGGPTPEAMVESALHHVRMLEDENFDQIKISLKSSSVPATVAAYSLLSKKVDYPLHIGITEAGTPLRGAAKSGVGLGILLWMGLGDTLRVSLTGDPLNEMDAAWEILRCLGLRRRGPEMVSCPTCGRTEIDLAGMAEAVEKKLRHVKTPIKVAVMGCVVNGPGEAREADIGLAGGRDCAVIFRKGEVVRKVRGEANVLAEFMKELDLIITEFEERCD